MNHLLSLETMSVEDMRRVLDLAQHLKANRHDPSYQPLAGQSWAMIFMKASTRTRVSFEVGVQELGGRVLYLNSADTQLGRKEPIRDTARVLGRMVHGAIIRTFAQQDLVDFAHFGKIPVINALTDDEHPCQVLADLLTMIELLGGYENKKVVFMGDGDNNMSKSWMWAAEKLGFDLVICAPPAYQPSAEYLAQFNSGRITCEPDPATAVAEAHVLYTDVWVSMGMEEETKKRLADLAAWQINSPLVKLAAPGAIVMHCLPAYRGQEISEECLEAHADTIFQEAENRLHAQKAILSLIAESR
ncbi:MAG: ornithine carbamoyltransferase [Verrucomicrobiales bacterium]|nr:ornithine carbamoyltransferase [Verrucomicrobiales bacterium]